MAYKNLRAGYEVLIETAANAGNDEAITMDESTPAAQATETQG